MKKILTLVIVLAMAVAVSIPAFAAPAAGDIVTVEGFAFHCGHGEKGNGSTTIAGQPKDFGKKMKIDLVRSDWDPTVWEVPHYDFKCAVCGNDMWVSFSNKNGVPDGKNIQLTGIGIHDPGTPDPEPLDFTITVFHRYLSDGEYLVYPGKGETFESKNEEYISWLNNVEGFTFIDLFLANTRDNMPASAVIRPDAFCSDVEKSGGDRDAFDLSFGEMTNDAGVSGIAAHITPLADGHYEITFWYGETIINSTYYYAACQLYHDILYGFNNSSLDSSFYNGHVPFGGVDNWAGDILHPVGLAHRDAIQMLIFGYTFDADWRYEPLSLTEPRADDLRVEYEVKITNALRTVCDDLGIDVDAFFAAYGADSVDVQAKYHAGI